MVRVCRLQIEKPSISFRVKECKDNAYYYLSNYNERKKLNQYIMRCDDILKKSKIVVKKKDMIQSSHLSEITFGTKGAILFSEQIIDYYNADVREPDMKTTSEENDECNDFLINEQTQLSQCQSLPIDHIKKYITRSFDVEELVQIENFCIERINKIKQLTESSCDDDVMMKSSTSTSMQVKNEKAIQIDKSKNKKVKRRIEPILISTLQL